MASGQKRTIGDTTGPVTRAKAIKIAVEEAGAKASYMSGRQGQRAPTSATAFRVHALPLHVNITHTPPVVSDNDKTDVAQLDPGFIGSTTLVPSASGTGSYGWKGSRRIIVDLQDNETGKKKKVTVQLTINAIVLDQDQSETDNSEEVEASEADISVPSSTTDVIA